MCQCGYKQDFEPTIDNMLSNGFSNTNCPSCVLGVLDKVVANEDKIRIEIMEDVDIDAKDIQKEEKDRLKAQRLENIKKLEKHFDD